MHKFEVSWMHCLEQMSHHISAETVEQNIEVMIEHIREDASQEGPVG